MCCQLWLSLLTFHSEMLAWSSAQIHCQFHASESRVALPAQGIKQDVQAESDTVLIPSKGEKWAAYTRLVLLNLYCYIKDKANRIKISFCITAIFKIVWFVCHLISFCLNYCSNAAWHGVDQSVALLRCYESPGCSDSGLQLFCIVGSGISHLPLHNTP